MRPEFWHDRWRTSQIGFHQRSVDQNLEEHWGSLALPQGSRVFVPLCGKSLDLLWLRNQGHSVIGVELSDIALQSFCLENGVGAHRRSLADFDIYQAANLELLRGDFFALTPALIGSVSAVYDRAALISWAPELRRQYVEHLAAISGPDAEILLVALEYDQSEMQGPPFSVDEAEIRRLYPVNRAIRVLARRDILANEPRLRARGVTRLSEVCYRLNQSAIQP